VARGGECWGMTKRRSRTGRTCMEIIGRDEQNMRYSYRVLYGFCDKRTAGLETKGEMAHQFKHSHASHCWEGTGAKIPGTTHLDCRCGAEINIIYDCETSPMNLSMGRPLPVLFPPPPQKSNRPLVSKPNKISTECNTSLSRIQYNLIFESSQAKH
jgi:hypothetical protein